jgi:NADH dehydrogenase
MDNSARKSAEILVLGGGFAGVTTAKTLLRKLISGFHITLVDKTDFQDFHADLYEIASSWMEPLPRQKHSYHDVVGTVAIPYADIFGKSGKLTTIADEVTSVDLKSKKVKLSSGRTLDYDYLVIALGSETNFFGIPHLEERAFTLKSVADAMNLRNSIEEKFFDETESMKIVIGGGGFTGIELAAELTNFVKKLCGSRNIAESSVSISILEASDTILGPASEWTKDRVQKRLKKLGVEVKLSSPIKSVDKKFVVLASEEKVDYDILVWTAGVKAHHLLSTVNGFELTKVGSVVVDEYLRAKNFDNVFVVGDSGTFTKTDGKSLPPTAQKAIYEGKLAATNLAYTLLDYPLLPYAGKPPKFFVPLGGKYAVAELGSFRLAGPLAWGLRELNSLKYFHSILPFFEAVDLWMAGVSVFERNDS